MTRLGFWRRDPPTRICPSQPGSMRVTFSGLTNIWRHPSGLGEFLIEAPWGVFDYVRVVATGPGQTVGYLPDPATYGGPITGFRWMPPRAVRFAIAGRIKPTARAILNHTGHGATFSAEFTEHESGGLPYWKIEAIAIDGDGHGYLDRSRMIVLLEDGSECVSPLVAEMRVGRGEPTLKWSVADAYCDDSFGRGAILEISYAPLSTTTGSETWRVTAVAVVSGGSGYKDGSALHFDAGHSDVITAAPAAIITVEDGAIVSVSVTDGGAASKRGVPQSFDFINTGLFYGIDKSLPPFVPSTSDLIVYEQQIIPGDEDTPTFSLEIDDDVDSETFGHVTNVSLVDPGDGHLAWVQREARCATLLNGVTLTLGSPVGNRGGVSICAESSFGTPATFRVALPEGYDNLETGIPGVERLSAGAGLAIRHRVQPSVIVSAENGSGATFEVYWRRTLSPLKHQEWEIYRVEASGGAGYGDYVQLSISPATSADKVRVAAVVRLYQKRHHPNVSISTFGFDGGARFDLDWEEQQSSGEPPTFFIKSVRVTDGGTGYSGEVPLVVSVLAGGSQVQAACIIAYANDRGEIAWASVQDGGRYYRRTSEAGYVDILSSGRYYRETAGVDVAEVAVRVISRFVGYGSGAALSAVINDDPNSPAFGTMTAVVDQPGSGYFLNTGLEYRNCPSIASDLPIQCVLSFPYCAAELDQQRLANPQLRLSIDDPDNPGLSTLIFEADVASVEELSESNRSLTLTPVLPGNSGQAVIEWGGVYDEEAAICSCCDVTTAICEDPPESGWPLLSGGFDAMQMVYSMPCYGVNANGDLLEDNGGPVYYRIIYDEQGVFSSWQYLCGECDEAIQTFEVLDQNGAPTYTTIPPVSGSCCGAWDGFERGTNGFTACSCFPDDEQQRCLWEPEISESGCWTGQYVTADVPCENPLP